MPAVSVHGVTISWSLSGQARDLLARPLSVFDPPPAGLPGAATPPTVRLDLYPAPESAADDPRGEGWQTASLHGVVETFRGPKGFLIWDHASRVLVPPDGAPIEAAIAPVERELEEGSATTALQIALNLGLRHAGLFHLHAAGLVLPSGVPVLVVGGSGAGKTTTTLALLEADRSEDPERGAHYLADDALYLSARDEDLRLVAFLRDFHVGPATLAMFPRLAPFAGPQPAYTDKRPVDPRRAYPRRFRRSASLTPGTARAVALFPTIAGGERTEIVSLARADAFGRLLGSSGGIVVDGVPCREENLAVLRALLEAVQCYEVRVGVDAMREREWWTFTQPPEQPKTPGQGTPT